MARKRKASKGKAKVAKAGSDPMISQADFLTLVRQTKNRRREMDEARGSLGNLIKQACEKKHLHRRAFSKFRSLDALSDKKLAEELRALKHYCEIGGLNDRASRQLDALDGLEPAQPNGNTVVPMKRRSRPKKEPAVQLDLSERTDAPLN